MNSEINRPNRILILITNLVVGGGAESQVYRLATELKARNWDVCVCCMSNPARYVHVLPDAEKLRIQLEQQQVEVHTLEMKRGVPDLRAVFRLRSLIRSFQPDVVHCHMFHANILGRITRIFCRMPLLICTAHNVRETSQGGGPTWHKELLYRLTDCLADKTTIICQAGFDRYLRVGAVPRKKLRMIPNGVDTDAFTWSEERRRSARGALGTGSDFVWLAVGRLVKQKDYPTLFRALEIMKREGFIVLIAGSGSLEHELREECAKRGLRDCVRFCGTRQDILDLYNAADAFVMSSEMEGMPVALLEAASVGLPAVVTDVGGNSEIVTDNVSGYLVPPASPAELAAGMQRLMEASVEYRRAMGHAAQQNCRQRYGVAAVMEKWLELYAEGMPPRALELELQS